MSDVFSRPQVNLYADVERSVTFCAALGFAETFRTPSDGVPPIHVEPVLDGFTLGVASVASARADHGLAVSSSGNAAEICLWSDDTDADFARLLALGATVLSQPHDRLGRLRVAWVADPDGNPIELVRATA